MLALAGIDPCAGAGLTADVRTISARGGRPAGVPTCLTVQSRHGFVECWPVPAARMLRMADAAFADGRVDAIKVGLCADAQTVVALAAWLRGLGDGRPPVVVDPVLSATAGGGPAAVEELSRALVEELAPVVVLFTPNLPELELLGGIASIQARRDAGVAVLVTGGHGEGDEIVDRLQGRDVLRDFVHGRLPVGPVHGTGCALSSSIATALARGLGVEDACESGVLAVRSFLARTRPSEDGLPVPLAID